jgi:hypothetical protein
MEQIKYRINKRTNPDTKKNLQGELIIAVKDINNNVYKQPINKQLVNGEYKISPIININVLTKKDLSKTSMNNLLKNKKIEFVQYNRKNKTYNPVEISLINKNSINVRLLNQNRWYFTVHISSDVKTTSIEPIKNIDGSNYVFNGSMEELEEEIRDYINQKLNWVDNNDSIIIQQPIKFIDVYNMTLDFQFFKLNGIEQYYIEKKRKYAELINIFNESIEAVENPPDINCVIYYFEQLHKKKQRKVFSSIIKELKELENKKKTIYLNDLKRVLDNKEITIFIYSVCGLEYSKKSEHYTDVSKGENLVVYIEDNHIYKINSKKHKEHLTKKINTNYDNANLKVNNLLDKDTLLNCPILSLDVKTDETKYLLLDDKNNNIISNSDVSLIVEHFINALGYDKKFINSTSTNFINIIKDKYNINHFSLFPFKIDSDVLLYKNNEIKQDKPELLLNFDKNKCFSNALYDAPFIPIFNIFVNKKDNYNNEPINEHYMYFIEVKEPNEIYFNNGYWFGWFINKYGGTKYINIKYVFNCDTLRNNDNEIYNPYSVMIDNLYNIANTPEQTIFIKNSINCFIGQMLLSSSKTFTTKKNIKHSTINDLKHLLTKEDIKKYNDYNIDIDTCEKKEDVDINNLNFDETLKIFTLKDNYEYRVNEHNNDIYIHWENKEKINKEMGADNKPLHILIRNIAQSYILDTMKKIKTINNEPLNKNDIIEINTDSIYITNSNNYIFKDIKNEPTNWKGWKIEEGYKNSQIKNKEHFIKNNDVIYEPYFYETNNNKYEYNIEYAGGGKTYRIKKIIDDKLRKDKNYSYIIIASHHDFLAEYRKNGYNTSTIAHYMFNNLKIKEKNIYVDEWGITNLNENIFLLRHIKKNFYFYGDDKQLEPVKSQKLNNEFIKTIAHKYNTEWTNYRNTFSKEYYESLINEKNINNINKIVDMFNTPINKAEIIIAFYNETTDKYNKLMLLKNNKKFENDDISINIPVINTENKLSLKNVSTDEQEQIYNKHSFNIDSKINNDIYTINDTINKYYISKNELLKFFKLGYCITLYGSQGKTYKNIHFVKDDIKALLKNGSLYTLISRLKFDNEEQYKINVMNMNIEEDNNTVKNLMKEINIIV